MIAIELRPEVDPGGQRLLNDLKNTPARDHMRL